MACVALVPETALDWYRAGQSVALATVVETWGSAPCPAGSQMAVAADGRIEGSVSGGCVEAAVVGEALEAIRTGHPKLLEYGISGADAFSVGLACGGTIRILVEPLGDGRGAGLPVGIVEELVDARQMRRAVALQTDLVCWGRRLVAIDAEDMDLPTRCEGDRLIVPHVPMPRLIIVGAVHIAQVLAPMAQAAGFVPVVVDPRSAFATAARFQGVTRVVDDTEDAMTQLGVDARTAIVTLGHDPDLDDPAIVAGMRGGAFYIGCLGSRRTHAARLERLAAAGLTSETLSMIRGPVGLDIGAVGPAEIAVAIIAELVAVRRASDQGRGSSDGPGGGMRRSTSRRDANTKAKPTAVASASPSGPSASR